MLMKLQVAKLGRVEYGEALELQENIMVLRQNGLIGDTLLLLEHPPVLTIGRRGTASNILVPIEQLKNSGVGIHEVSRGGDVTYHGPGQIVGYPIMDLNHFGKDIKDFVWKVEEVFIRLLDRE
jgi:lipoyl(octanoyl) transferase